MPELKVRFIDYVSMLGQNCLFQLGKLADPTTGQVNPNLEAAFVTIEILAMIKEKTKNNLTNEESSYLENTLSSLRLTYVDETNRVKDNKDKTTDNSEDKTQV